VDILMENYTQEIQLVVFKLDGEEYGIDILQVKEIIRLLDITRVPKAPWFIEGVISLRGTVIPVIDLRKRFQLTASNRDEDCRIIVVMVDDITFGIIVDSVNEVLRLNKNDIEPSPTVAGSTNGAYIKGIGKLNDRLITLLELDKLIEH